MMTFNKDELLKIKKATSGWFGREARLRIAEALSDLRPRIERAKPLDGAQGQEALNKLVNEATAKRHDALQAGARNYKHPDWAAAAACESWLHELALGTPEDIARVEQVVDELSKRKS